MLTKRLGFYGALFLLVASYASLASAQGGIVYIAYPGARWNDLFCMDIDKAGQIFVAGRTYVTGSYDFLNVSVRANGSTNVVFGGGVVKTSVGETAYNNDYAYTCVLQPDGKLISAGMDFTRVKSDYNKNARFAIARHNPDGTLDRTFNPQKTTYGIVTTDFFTTKDGGDSERVNDILLQDDKRILAIGTASSGPSVGSPRIDDFLMVRYTADGKLDNTYGSSGVVRLAFPGFVARSYRAAHHGGGIVVGGVAVDKSYLGQFALARLDVKGNVDPTFGAAGRVLSGPFIGSDNTFQDMAVDVLTGDIVVAGSTYSPDSGTQIIVGRFLANGSLDNSFGNNGYVTHPGFLAEAVDVQPDGKIIITGSVAPQGGLGFSRLVFVRFKEDGSLDRSFGTQDSSGYRVGSVVFEDLGWVDAFDVRAEADGTILAVGRWRPTDGTSTVGIILKLRENGELDPSFLSSGLALLNKRPVRP